MVFQFDRDPACGIPPPNWEPSHLVNDLFVFCIGLWHFVLRCVTIAFSMGPHWTGDTSLEGEKNRLTVKRVLWLFECCVLLLFVVFEENNPLFPLDYSTVLLLPSLLAPFSHTHKESETHSTSFLALLVQQPLDILSCLVSLSAYHNTLATNTTQINNHHQVH